MVKFLFGVIIGVVLGILAMSANPNLVAEVRSDVAALTALVMRSAGRAAEEVGETAEDLADDAEPEGESGQPQ